MRLARLAAQGVAVTVLAATAGAQQPVDSAVSSPPELTLWSPASANPLMNAGMSGYFISVERDAYLAAFEVGRDGRMRVLYPRSPKDDGRVKGRKAVSVMPWSYDLFGMSVSPTEVPYVVALASDRPIDLSRFGTGKSWQYRVRMDGAWQADVTMENVGRLVQSDPTQRFSGDYGYVAPRIPASTQLALSRCMSLSTFAMGRDSRDYWLYRDLWMSFGPRDGYWFGSAATWLGWGFSGFAPMIFPSMGAWPTRGGGCTQSIRTPSYAFAPITMPLSQTPVAPPSDSTTKPDSAGGTTGTSAGRTIAIEQARGTDGADPMGRPQGSRFSREEIARIRSEFYARPSRNGGGAQGEAIASRPDRPFVDRSGGTSWAPEPLERRPSGSSAGGTSRWAQEEGGAVPRWPNAGMNGGRPGRYDPERANAGASSSGSSGSTGWQRPTSVGGADVTRAGSPGAPGAGDSGARPAGAEGGARSPITGGSSPAGSAPAGTTPRGQQQQQQQQ